MGVVLIRGRRFDIYIYIYIYTYIYIYIYIFADELDGADREWPAGARSEKVIRT